MGKIMLNGISYSSPTASGVSGVKGNAETSYRTGNVNITTENIGAAKSSIYGDTTVSMGREHASTVGARSFAFGETLTASGSCSHAEGYLARATGTRSHAEGYYTTASGSYSHAENYHTIASGSASHAEGYLTNASNYTSHAGGKFNKAMTNGGAYNTQVGDVFVIGNGTSDTARSNALRVTYQGDILGTKAFQSSGADYAEYIKPWWDGNITRIGSDIL